MKKTLLLSLAVSLLFVTRAQIPNNSFENWALDTFYLEAGAISSLPADTITFFDPVNWSTSNMLTGLDSLGGVSLVTQSSNAYHGGSAIQLVTDSIKLPVIPNFPALKINIPGFALNGDFPITAESLTGGGATITPISIIGAGQPFTQRLTKISGYYNYAPVFNPNTGSNDTCIVWATLRKGSVAIADGIFKSTNSTAGAYQPFEADFVYHSCELPDTLVVFLASSVPNVQQILNPTSGLIPGSVLLVDSIYYNDAPLNFNFTPIARPDLDSTTKNVPKNIFVKNNDEDCNDATASLTVTIAAGPYHGTAVVAAGAITYSPALDYVGIDTIVYTITDAGGESATATTRILVREIVGISQANLIPVAVYPVPAQNNLNVSFENPGQSTLRIFNAVGGLVLTTTLSGNHTSVDIAQLPTSVYTLEIANEQNTVIARSKFTVSK